LCTSENSNIKPIPYHVFDVFEGSGARVFGIELAGGLLEDYCAYIFKEDAWTVGIGVEETEGDAGVRAEDLRVVSGYQMS